MKTEKPPYDDDHRAVLCRVAVQFVLRRKGNKRTTLLVDKLEWVN